MIQPVFVAARLGADDGAFIIVEVLALDAVGQRIAELAVGVQQLHEAEAGFHVFLGRFGVDGEQGALLGGAGHVRADEAGQLHVEAHGVRVGPAHVAGPGRAGAHGVAQGIGHFGGDGGVRVDVARLVPAVQTAEHIHVLLVLPDGNDLGALRRARLAVGDDQVGADDAPLRPPCVM